MKHIIKIESVLPEHPSGDLRFSVLVFEKASGLLVHRSKSMWYASAVELALKYRDTDFKDGTKRSAKPVDSTT